VLFKVLKSLASHVTQVVALEQVAQLGLQVAHLSTPASKKPATHEQLLAASLLVSAQALHVDATEHVAHLVAHLVHVPLFSKKPSEQPQVLSNGLNAAPAMQTLQTAGFSSLHTAQSLVSHGKH
jgi:hypothetical protein